MAIAFTPWRERENLGPVRNHVLEEVARHRCQFVCAKN